MTRPLAFRRRPIWLVLFALLAGCRSYQYAPDIPSEQFDPAQSLGELQVRFRPEQRNPPTLRSAFYRQVIEPEMGFAGTYVIGIVYPTMKIDQDYSGLTLQGEPLGDGHWRFAIPRKRGWDGPHNLLLHFPNAWGEKGQSFLFRYLEGQHCLNDYRLDPQNGTPLSGPPSGDVPLQVSVRFRQPGCLLPCSPSLHDPAKCSNIWR